jgi:Flp pilus assembly protein TadG
MARKGWRERLTGAAAAALRGFMGGNRGGVAIWAGFLIVPMLGFMGLGVDSARGYMVRARLSQALDAAGLAAGKQFGDETKAREAAQMVFAANFPSGYMDSALTGPEITFNTDAQTVRVTASAQLPTYFVHLLGVNIFNVSAETEVMRNGNNLEIALVLDVTGSMNSPSQKIADLKVAAKDLIDIVVYADQSQYYSKVAIVPYSNAVNVDTYAAQVRGSIDSTTKTITGITRANPAVVTAANHGFANGTKIFISGINGMTQVNSSTTARSSASTNSPLTRPAFWVVANATTNSFQLRYPGGSALADSTNWNTYSSGGVIHCTNAGCPFYAFQSAESGSTWRALPVTTCASERVGSEAFTDAPPSSAPLGRSYAPANNNCIASTIMPLASDKATLKAKIDSLTTNYSTAGQIGIAWGWYMISPNFAYLWPGASQPAAYTTPELIKIAVIMTDGAFNTAHCNGVIARDSGTGSGNAYDHNTCNATNGSSFSQAQQLCTAMKAADITIFTIGFQIESEAGAEDFLRNCATSSWHFYNAADGGALRQAFRSIAVNISRLRLSR